MTASAILALLLAAGSPASPAASASRTIIDDRLRVRDLALETSSGDLVVAGFPKGAALLTLSEMQRLDLLRKRIPGARFTLRDKGDVQFMRAISNATPNSGSACFRARIDIPAGNYLSQSDVANTACIEGATDSRMRYDAAAAAPFAHASIPAGSYLGRLRLPAAAPVARGQSMHLRTRVGPVVIERNVIALQPGQHGKRLFVRTDDGELLASRLAAAASEKSQ